jgi:hypothetical protein
LNFPPLILGGDKLYMPGSGRSLERLMIHSMSDLGPLLVMRVMIKMRGREGDRDRDGEIMRR